MVHCCEESFFEIFWGQQMQRVIRCLLHDLSNYLTGNLALSELFCAKEQEVPFEKFVVIRDNCYKEREILKQLSHIHHANSGNTTYIDLQTFVSDLQPLLKRLLPGHAKFNVDSEKSLEVLIKFDPVLLQRVFLLTTLLVSEVFEYTSNPELNIHIVCKENLVICQIKSNISLVLNTKNVEEIKADELFLTRIYGPMVCFYLEKYNGCFAYEAPHEGASIINLKFPIVA